MPKLINLGKTEAIDSADDRAAIGLEWIATAALIKSADWNKCVTFCCSFLNIIFRLIMANDLVSWMKQELSFHNKESTPLQLQVISEIDKFASLDCDYVWNYGKAT